ncbi:MAG: MFS transporter [Gammaproteobacteria bacterium]|nr:MFS transporter [Gammaproteobacteria bacterium]
MEKKRKIDQSGKAACLDKLFLRGKVSKNVWIMGVVSFFNDLSSEMIYPLIPIFLTTILGAPVAIVGMIEGIAEATGSISKVIFGLISDQRQSRKPFVVSGYLLSTLAKILLGFSYLWTFVLMARFTDRLGKGIRTASRDALLAESSAPENRGLSFGLHRALDTFGAVIGPLLAIIFMTQLHDGFQQIFYLATIPGAIGVILLALFVKEKQKQHRQKPVSLRELSHFTSPFKTFTLINLLFALGNSSDVFLILRAKQLGFSTITTILVYVLFNISYAIFSTPAGYLSDQIGSKKVIIIGSFLFCIVYLCFSLIEKSYFLWLLFPIYGIYMAATEGVGKAYIANLVPQKKLASAYGVYQTITGIGILFASIIAGLLWSHIGVAAPFLFGSLTALTAGILFLTIC